MDYISPITNRKAAKQNENSFLESQSPRIRKTRSDKKHILKFPTDDILAIKLKTLWKQAVAFQREHGAPEWSLTEFNSRLLVHALENQGIIDFTGPYRDTKRYFHVKILETDYQQFISGSYGIAVRENLSERRVVFYAIQSMVSWLEKGGGLKNVLQ